MSQSIVPIQIRKHLVPFFYEEFQGIEAIHLGKKVKACQITMNSSIGFMLRLALEKTDKPVVGDHFNVYISIQDQLSDATIYKFVSGEYSFLKVPQIVNDKINDLLEDQFRIAFVFFITGMIKINPNLKIKEAIVHFMQEYELEESGVEISAFWRLLNREQKKNRKLSRMQINPANRVLNR